MVLRCNNCNALADFTRVGEILNHDKTRVIYIKLMCSKCKYVIKRDPKLDEQVENE